MGNKKIHMVEVPAKQIPPFKFQIADKSGVTQIMMTTGGGLGDQVCAEPALRHAFEVFKGHEISLITDYPDLFRHLPFKRIYARKEAADLVDDEWIALHTYLPIGNMGADFVGHHFTQAVDYASLCALQRQLPVRDRQIKLTHAVPADPEQTRIAIHPGKYWPANTFPREWWSTVISMLCEIYPNQVAIVGKDVSEDHGTVDVIVPDGCVDLRNKQSITELAGVLFHADVVITNDSGPLHVAAAGEAHILFIAGSKHPDYITHWRRGQFGWRMKNLGLDGLWNHQSTNPIRRAPLQMDEMSAEVNARVLPTPASVVYQVRHALI